MTLPPTLTIDHIRRWLSIATQVEEWAPEGEFERLLKRMGEHFPVPADDGVEPVVQMAAMLAYLDAAMADNPGLAGLRSSMLRGGSLLTALEDVLVRLK